MEYTTKSLNETKAVAKEFLASLKRGDAATVVGLYGDLGSGKTTFVQAVARLLSLSDAIQSPTFVIIKSYKIQASRRNAAGGQAGFKTLIHIDAYRLETGREIERLRFTELVADPDNFIFVEWPEKIADAMPEHRKLRFEFIDETTRKIKVEPALGR